MNAVILNMGTDHVLILLILYFYVRSHLRPTKCVAFG